MTVDPIKGASSVRSFEAGTPMVASPPADSGSPSHPDRFERAPSPSDKVEPGGLTPRDRARDYFTAMDGIEEALRNKFGKPIFKKPNGAPDRQAEMNYSRSEDPDAHGAIEAAKHRRWDEACRLAGRVLTYATEELVCGRQVEPPAELKAFHQEGLALALEQVRACQRIVRTLSDQGSKKGLNSRAKSGMELIGIKRDGDKILEKMEERFKKEEALRRQFGLPS